MSKNGNMSVWSADYWRTASSEFKKIKVLTFAALVITLSVVLGFFYIPVALNLHISFTFLLMSFGAMVYGPLVGLLVGALFDIISFIVHPFGGYFPGYTLSAMLGCFIYGLFLYQSRITILRIFLAKLIVNYGVNVGLGSLWSSILFGKGYLFFLGNSMIKNTVMLPIEVTMLVIFLQVFLPFFVRTGIMPGKNLKHISFI
ncbi:folate family ECF transporter S component [Sporolactobacillus sp. THM7-4]|nr:folate family ECF transporter S component [Sporolactobacillus sp. THM7-4]